MGTYFGRERRESERVKIHLPIICSIERCIHLDRILGVRRFRARSVDLSEAGATIAAKYKLPIHTPVNLFFLVHKKQDRFAAHEVISLPGEVVSCFLRDDGGYHLGISFGLLDEDKQGKFFDLICAY